MTDEHYANVIRTCLDILKKAHGADIYSAVSRVKSILTVEQQRLDQESGLFASIKEYAEKQDERK